MTSVDFIPCHTQWVVTRGWRLFHHTIVIPCSLLQLLLSTSTTLMKLIYLVKSQMEGMGVITSISHQGLRTGEMINPNLMTTLGSVSSSRSTQDLLAPTSGASKVSSINSCA